MKTLLLTITTSLLIGQASASSLDQIKQAMDWAYVDVTTAIDASALNRFPDYSSARELFLTKAKTAADNFKSCVSDVEASAKVIRSKKSPGLQDKFDGCYKNMFTMSGNAGLITGMSSSAAQKRTRFCMGVVMVPTGNLLTVPCMYALGGDVRELDQYQKMQANDLFGDKIGSITLETFRPASRRALKQNLPYYSSRLFEGCTTAECHYLMASEYEHWYKEARKVFDHNEMEFDSGLELEASRPVSMRKIRNALEDLIEITVEQKFAN